MIGKLAKIFASIIFLFCVGLLFNTKVNAALGDSATCYYTNPVIGPYELILTLPANADQPTAEFTKDSQNQGRTFAPVLSRSDFIGSNGAFGCPVNLTFFIVEPIVSVQTTTYTQDYATLNTTTSVVTLADGTTVPGNNTTPGGNSPTPSTNNPSGEPIDCDDFTVEEKNAAGEVIKTYNLVKQIFTLIMIAGPILLIVFGTIDFAKATLSADEQAIKKAGTNFGKRGIAVVLLFLLPLIINLILGVAMDADIFTDVPQTCLE